MNSKQFLCVFFVLVSTIAGGMCQRGTEGGSHPQSGESGTVLPQFEVAAVKPNPEGGVAGVKAYPGGRLKCEFCTFDMLMISAFDVERYQITGAPDWTHREGYSLEALPPSSESQLTSPPSPNAALTAEQRQMMQSLLISRFQLRFHRESKVGAIYVLMKGDGKLNLQPARNSKDSPWAMVLPGRIEGGNASIPLLARRLSDILERPVLDETGLNGSFDFKYEDSAGTSIQNYEDFVTAVLVSVKEIGLKLKSAKGPVETIVIDHVERPSEN